MINHSEYLKHPLEQIPRILGMINRAPVSSTYGCADRDYWHIRSSDFPNGNYVYILPALALVYQTPFEGNPYYRAARVKDLCIAMISFCGKSMHHDGAIDEFYPGERSYFSTSYALYGITEACQILGLDQSAYQETVRKMADWIAAHEEGQPITNHLAVDAISLYNSMMLLGDTKYEKTVNRKIEMVLTYQDEEGWYREYEGCDLGYLTMSIDFLGHLYQKTKNNDLRGSLMKAVRFCRHFMHRDGSFGGEYSSRNNLSFFSHGVEILGNEDNDALELGNHFLGCLARNKKCHVMNDRHFFSYVNSYLRSYLDGNKDRGFMPKPRENGAWYFKNAKLWVARTSALDVVVSVAKGGVIKAYNEKRAILSDTGYVGVLKERCQISHQVIDVGNKAETGTGAITVESRFHEVNEMLLSPVKMIVLRILLLIPKFNLFFRGFIIKKAILHKSVFPLVIKRRVTLGHGGVVVEDVITPEKPVALKSFWLSSDYACVYTAASRYFQESALLPWHNLSSAIVEHLAKGTTVKVRREVYADDERIAVKVV